MKNKRFNIAILLVAGVFVSCDDVWEPAIENNRDIDVITKEPESAQAIIGNAYIMLWGSYPNTNDVYSDLATDDAVSNDYSNKYQNMATGWSSLNNPLSIWDNNYHALQYINLLLEKCDEVAWSDPEVLRVMYNDHFKGEAYALRALYHFYLLQYHAGMVDGEMMGIPLHLRSEDGASDFNYPRNTFKECIDQIMSDINEAMKYLPDELGDVSKDGVPDKYLTYGESKDLQGYYNRAFGEKQKGKIDGHIIKAIQAQVAFYAASPAFKDYSGISEKEAADYLSNYLARINGIAGMDPDGYKWSTDKNMIDNLQSNENPKEVLWRAGTETSTSTAEENYFPASLYGKGKINPTQNLVDAFPMANGYPIDNPASGYDSQAPYVGRDKRFYEYIIYNGCVPTSASSEKIDVSVNSKTDDRIGTEKGTRTGYYLRKFTRDDINLDPTVGSKHKHYTTRIRYTELFLDYAEMANEAFGPTGNGANGYSAYDVIKALRQRAGIISDNYLESIKDNKDEMRKLIRNERRIELCFEGKRFWDLRRWKVDLDKLNEPAKGMRITVDMGKTTYEVIDVAERNFKEYMYYAPIPYYEVLKFSALQQNTGW